jgi:hypothetical protein
VISTNRLRLHPDQGTQSKSVVPGRLPYHVRLTLLTSAHMSISMSMSMSMFHVLSSLLTCVPTPCQVVKFMRQLVPHEPRLAKKLVEPLLNLIQTTQAKSLQ